MAFDQIGLEAVLEGVNDFVSGGEEVNGAVAAMGGAMDLGSSVISGAGDLIGGALSGLITTALSFASAAGGALVDFFSDSFSGALEAEQTIARLGQVIESTGGIAGVTVDEAKYLADEFKHLAGGSDDAVLSIIDMGLRMGTISEEEMPAFIQSTLDLGAVMGDSAKAAQLMARAQEDPVGVLGALRKAGILVNESTEAQIKAMMDAGDTAGAYALLMGTVEAATAGAAETMANTTAGQWAIFKETIADAGETIMGAFLPALNGILTSLAPLIPVIESVGASIAVVIQDLISGDVGVAFDDLRESIYSIGLQLGFSKIEIQAFNQILTDAWNFIQANVPLVQATFETVFASVQSVFETVSAFVTDTLMPAIATIWEQTGLQLPSAQETFEGVMNAIVSVTRTVTDFITNTLIPILTTAVDWVVANWPMIQSKMEEIWAAVQPVLQATVDFFVNTLIPNFQEVVGWVIENWPMIQIKIEEVMTAINTVISAVINEVVPFVVEKFTEIKAWVDTNWPLIQSAIETVIKAISSVITDVVNGIQTFWEAHLTTIKTVAQAIWDAIKLNIDSTIALIEGIIKTAMQLITGDWEGAWETIKETANTIWENMKTQIDTSIHAIQTVVQDVIDSLKIWWGTKWDEMKTAVATIIADILASLTTKINEIKTAFTSIDWVGIGSSIISGIQSGIAGAVQDLVNAAAQAALDAFNAAQAALGIHSPSTLFVTLGKQTMQGMAKGILDNTYIVENEIVKGIATITNRAIGALTHAAPGIESASNKLSDSIMIGLGLREVCDEVGKAAEDIGSQCLPDGIQGDLGLGLGLGLQEVYDEVGKVVEDIGNQCLPESIRGGLGLGLSTSGSVDPVSTGEIGAGGNTTYTGNTYQYAPTYGGAPVSPERDFAIMQVMPIG